MITIKNYIQYFFTPQTQNSLILKPRIYFRSVIKWKCSVCPNDESALFFSLVYFRVGNVFEDQIELFCLSATQHPDIIKKANGHRRTPKRIHRIHNSAHSAPLGEYYFSFLMNQRSVNNLTKINNRSDSTNLKCLGEIKFAESKN